MATKGTLAFADGELPEEVTGSRRDDHLFQPLSLG
jgi:hypothetical protein